MDDFPKLSAVIGFADQAADELAVALLARASDDERSRQTAKSLLSFMLQRGFELAALLAERDPGWLQAWSDEAAAAGSLIEREQGDQARAILGYSDMSFGERGRLMALQDAERVKRMAEGEG